MNDSPQRQSVSCSFPPVVDSTMLLAMQCPTQFFFKHCLGLSKWPKSIHLHAGGAFAEFMQVTRLSFYRDGLSLDDSLLKATTAFIHYWGDFDPPLPAGTYKDFPNVLAAAFDYFYNYNPATDHIQPYRRHDGSPAVEFTFAEPIPLLHPDTGDPLLYAGRNDMVGVYNSLEAIVDEKTAKSFSENWAAQFRMRGQFIGYCWGAQQSGIKTNVAIVRGIAIQQTQIKHIEIVHMYPQWQIEQWYQNMLQRVAKNIEYYKRFRDTNDLDSFEKNFGDICASYGGCDMLDLCTSQKPRNWYDTFFVHRWNPLHKDNERETEPQH